MTVDDTPKGTVDGDGPVETEDRLADILEDPETDTDEDEVQADDTPDDIEDDGDEADEDDEGEESEDSDEDDAGDDDDGPDDTEIKGGRIAPRNAKVKLDDGTLTTVEDLLKGTLRQSDYSRKTQDLAREREELKAEVERNSQASQELAQQRELVDAMLEQWKPRPPENPQEDPMGWITYQQQVDAWNQWQSHLKGQMQSARERAEAEQREKTMALLEKENERLIQAIPAFGDPAKRQNLFDDLVKFGTDQYGFTREEIGSIADNRMIRALFDLRQAKARAAKAPEVKDKVSKKPKVMRGSKRGSDGKNSAKRAAMDRLRETGSARDAEAALRNLDL